MDQQKRYQIFVSSTFADLEEERGKVMETILSYDCFPAGMEMFPAMDEEIFKYIKRIIDDSDYFLLIIGGCYGSLAEDGVSWTEKEYDYAVSKGIPIIVFDHKDFTKLPANKTDLDDKKRKKLIAFKKKAAKGRLIKKWTNQDNLALAVSNSLRRVLELQPRIGWVRANSVISGDAREEIERLKKEILRRQDDVKRLEEKNEGLETQLKSYDSVLTKTDKDYNILESKYQAAQQEIENNKKKISDSLHEVKRLETKVESLDAILYGKESDLKKKDNDYSVLELSYKASQQEIESHKKRIVYFQNEIKRLEGIIDGLKTQLKNKEADLKKKDSNYSDLESKYQATLQEIKNYKETIRILEAGVEKFKSSTPTKSYESQSESKTFNKTFKVRGISFKMVHVEGGTFLMGANENDIEAYPDEKPPHKVKLSEYWIGETQVTRALWKAVMRDDEDKEDPSEFKGDPNRPVESVSWEECKEFIRRLNKLTDQKFRFPTEAQWEFAARGGNLGKDNKYRYAGSDSIGDVAWFSKRSTHSVKGCKPNELGLYDMSGNVFEWCSDWYGNYNIWQTVNPIGPSKGESRVIRGGSWANGARGCRISNRLSYSPTDKFNYLGLRLAL